MLPILSFKTRPSKNEGKIEEIDSPECEIIDVYLENGNVWKAFLRKMMIYV